MSEYAKLFGCDAHSTFSVAGARQATEEQSFDLVLVDLDLPDGNGLELISELDLASCGQIAVVTGNPTARSAAKAFQLPVLDYIEKPIDGDKLRALLDRASRSFAARPAPAADAGEACGAMIGASPIMLAIFRNIRLVASFEVTVLICGESGTGKDLAARAIHEFSGRRGAMISVNCGAVTPELLGSQLFGHERGSFTGAVKQHQGFFEQAAGGTIFLDEITEMPLNLQVHLLRVLENRTITRIGGTTEQKIDVRVIAATNRDPKKAVTEGRLREDLYYRLIDFPLTLPALRERGGDAMLLAQRFLDRLNTRYKTGKTFAPDTELRLKQHSWPGNVRELKHVVQRSYILGKDVVTVEPENVSVPAAMADSGNAVQFTVGMTFEEIENKMLQMTLQHYNNDKAKAAAALDISVKTIYNRLARVIKAA
jgi:DNA-binding NtrC family response regulator